MSSHGLMEARMTMKQHPRSCNEFSGYRRVNDISGMLLMSSSCAGVSAAVAAGAGWLQPLRRGEAGWLQLHGWTQHHRSCCSGWLQPLKPQLTRWLVATAHSVVAVMARCKRCGGWGRLVAAAEAGGAGWLQPLRQGEAGWSQRLWRVGPTGCTR